ncbi:MAG: hypothetical protein FWF83_01745, partial [Clostridiales bacterium]|nr:hypothetical protein [Clostridiales bacterium]
MATNNVNSNYFSVAAYTNKGLSGMVSGMDTEGMVKQMMAATQKKIDTQLAAKQRTQWRQSYYRDIISSINTLRNKYFNTAFDASPLNNFASARFFNSKVSSVSGNNAVRVISTSHNAPIGDVKISVGQLATSTALASDKAVGNLGSIKGTVFTQDMADAFDKALVLSVSGTQGQIRVDLNGVSTQDAMLDRINNALEGTGATAKLYGGKLRFVTDSSTRSVIVNARSTDLALKMTGLVAGDRTALLETGEPGQMLEGSMMINPSAGVTLTVNLDGVTKQITINPTTLYDPNYMATNPAYDPERDPAHPLYNPSHPAFNPVNIPGSGLYDPDDPEYNPIYDPDSEQFIPFKEAWDPDDPRNFKITAEAIAARLNP